MNKRVVAIIVSGGSGKRLGGDIPKQYVEIEGKTILQFTIEKFCRSNYISEIVVVANIDYMSLAKEITGKVNSEKKISIVEAGAERYLSVFKGIKYVYEKSPDSFVLIHDAVRPNLPDYIIKEVALALNKSDAVSTAIPVIDTLYLVSKSGIEIKNRDGYYAAQTPQGFKLKKIFNAYSFLLNNKSFIPTDDISAYCFAYPSKDVYIVKGSIHNNKITYKEDIEWFESLVRTGKNY
jgi:ribitol-5-phosphate 2-dehydrogenase (NADP+) / D-ribitol-5-phosphate cytidylyltransferase